MNRTQKTSSGTYKKMEPTGPKVLSRYLRSSTGSCHDNCKCAIKETTETKPINSFPKRVPKLPADRNHVDTPNSVNRIRKLPSVIPRVTTRNLKNNNVVKDQILKKEVATEPKKRDLKSGNSRAKTSSRTPRRHSDIFIPNKDTSLPSSRFPKRRLSEVIHTNRDLASVSRVNRNESRKDSKLPIVNKKSTSLKSTVSTPKISANVPPLRTYKSTLKLEVRGSRKPNPPKPIEEVVPEKTLHVIEPKHDVEITKSQSQRQTSPDSTHPRNGLQKYSPSKEDDNPAKDGLQDDQIGLQVSSPSIEDDNPSKEDQQDDQNELQVSSPSIEDDSPSKEDQKDDQKGLKVSSPSMENDTTEKNSQQNDYISDSEVNETNATTSVGKLVVETSDGSPSDLRFRRGTILSQSENNSRRELAFKKGTELDAETKETEKTSLRRLSSDGAVCIPESQVISVDLKHQETKEKIDPGLSNNVIEETASKLIRARKSKVKALVGAFENIVSGSQTS